MNFLRLITAAAILTFGAWVSLRYSLGAWHPQSDIADPLALWNGVSDHGLGFVKSWRYMQDNWLLSLVPLTSLIFMLFGTNPILVVGIGWLIFVACVGMTSFLVYRIAGRRAAVPVAVVLMFPNYWAIGHVGYLAHPVDHNISMAWALLALVLALRAVKHASLVSVAAVGLCVFVDVVSDPWAGPAIALPLILVSALLCAINWRSQSGWFAGGLCVAAATAFLAAWTRLFGALDFLPSTQFTITNASGLIDNAGWMFRAVAIIFNIVPHTNIDSAPVNMFDFLGLATVLISVITLTAIALRRAPIEEQLACGVAILSIAGVTLAFLIDKFPYGADSLIVGRFVPNVYFFGVFLTGTIAARNWKRLHVAGRAVLIIYGLLFVTSGIFSYPGLWTGQVPIPTSKSTTDLGAFLEQNGLTYGYGPYWGSNALAMNWLTDGHVTIRPVAFDNEPDRVSSLRPQTSRLWYEPDDEPVGTAETFLVINNDGENCPFVESCVATAIRQFGVPSRRLTYGNTLVLVWPHPIVSQIVDH